LLQIPPMSEPSKSVDPAIIAALRAVLPHSHSPYSKFKVAAAVTDETGQVHYGINIENAAFPVGTCAEQSAIGALVTSGARRIERVVLTGSNTDNLWPCGACRQRIAEFAGPDCDVVVVDGAAEVMRTPFWDLLPKAFTLDVK
jgi:cytidine deaminase